MNDRCKVLFLYSLILLSFSYIYDIPTTIHEQIIYDGINRTSKLAFLYSIYALPNIVVPIFFRWIFAVDKPYIPVFLCFLVFVGQILYSIGVFKMNYPIMLIGRLIIGLGGENFSVLINRLILKEIQEQDLSFMLGFLSSVSRFGSILNFLCSPALSQKIHRIIPCIIGSIFTFVSFVVCFKISKISQKNTKAGYIVLDQSLRAKNKVKTVKIDDNENDFLVEKQKNILVTANDQNQYNIKSLDYSQIFYQIDFNQSPFTPWEQLTDKSESKIQEPLKKVELKELTVESDSIFYETSLTQPNSFHSAYYLLAIISFFIAMVWSPFYALAPTIFKSNYNVTQIESGYLLSIIDILYLFLTPLIGFLADKCGRKIYFILIGSALLFAAHVMLLTSIASAYVVVVILGIAGPFLNCYWSCIPSLVSEKNLTYGFAIIFCLLNLAFTISPLFLGILMSKQFQMKYIECFFVAISTASFVLTVLLSNLDKKHKLGLNSKRNVRNRNL